MPGLGIVRRDMNQIITGHFVFLIGGLFSPVFGSEKWKYKSVYLNIDVKIGGAEDTIER